jgi:hypothetical protein
MTVRNAATMREHGAAWQSAGYSGSGNVVDLLGTLQGKVAIVCGNAAGVFEEYEYMVSRLSPDKVVVFGVNDVGMYLPRLDHWVSLHSDNISVWKAVRWMNSKDQESAKYHSVDAKKDVNYVWDRLTPVFALSGYFAMQIAYLMQAEKIVLCGCPGSTAKRFFEFAARTDFGYGNGNGTGDAGVRQQLIEEMNRLPEFKKRVRSLSGWTKHYFGRPW